MNKLTAVLMALVVLTVTSAMAVPQFAAEGITVFTSTTSDAITITGSAIDAEGMKGQLLCGGMSPIEFDINDDGTFTISTQYGGLNGCAPGTATLNIGEATANVNIASQQIMVPKGGSPPSEAVFDLGSQPAGHMPEFSTITLGLAVIGVGLGLVLLRKHQ